LNTSPLQNPSIPAKATVGRAWAAKEQIMSKIHWSSPVDGNFDTAADWSTGSVPGTSARVFLDALGGTPYTVTASSDETVGSLSIATGDTLSITGGTGAYKHSRGQMKLKSLDGGKKYDFSFELS